MVAPTRGFFAQTLTRGKTSINIPIQPLIYPTAPYLSGRGRSLQRCDQRFNSARRLQEKENCDAPSLNTRILLPHLALLLRLQHIPKIEFSM